MKVLSVVGARPQFVKAAAVSRVLRRSHDELLVHTGQHYDDNMSAQFFRELDIPEPEINLDVRSGPHGEQTARMLERLERVVVEHRPDAVLVYGDTNSTLAGALVAVKCHVAVAHVEAGLRSFDRSMPEEINRIVADRVATWCFCPSRTAVANLAHEGITNGVHLVGDVMADALADAVRRAPDGVASRYGVAPGKYLLATIHRASNTDDRSRLQMLVDALERTAEAVVFPVHPRTREALRTSAVKLPGNVIATDPVGYLEMVALERCARLILTDSGGVQKEAYWLGVPCVTLRAETEWVETVDAGWNVVVGHEPRAIVDAVRTFRPPAERPTLYGDGTAAACIVECLR